MSKLKTKEDFDRLYRWGNKFFSKDLIFYFLANQKQETRFAVVISSKVSKKAVKRNLIKKRIKAVLQQNKDCLKQIEKDVLIVALPGAVVSNFTDLKQEIEIFLSSKNFKKRG